MILVRSAINMIVIRHLISAQEYASTLFNVSSRYWLFTMYHDNIHYVMPSDREENVIRGAKAAHRGWFCPKITRSLSNILNEKPAINFSTCQEINLQLATFLANSRRLILHEAHLNVHSNRNLYSSRQMNSFLKIDQLFAHLTIPLNAD